MSKFKDDDTIAARVASRFGDDPIEVRVASRFAIAWDEGEEEEQEPEPEDDPFSREEMREGYTIQDSRHGKGGVDVSQSGKHIGHFEDRDKAMHSIKQHMHSHGYFPNVYYVNDHGNVDLLDEKGNSIDSRV